MPVFAPSVSPRTALVLCGVFVLAAALGYSWSRTIPAAEFRGSMVVIDPGHGGKDAGATGRAGVREKELTLAVAVHLEMLLNRAGIYTALTRRDDRDLADPDAYPRKPQDLRRRAELANRLGADVFVSIHANSFPNSAWRGAQTFYYPGAIESERLAQHIQDALRRHLGPNRRQPRPGAYRVLRETHMPSTVVEIGFLSNPEEEALLARPDYQRRVAEAIYEGILSYLISRDP